jgi:hypothetical protein
MNQIVENIDNEILIRQSQDRLTAINNQIGNTLVPLLMVKVFVYMVMMMAYSLLSHEVEPLVILSIVVIFQISCSIIWLIVLQLRGYKEIVIQKQLKAKKEAK